MSKKILIIIGVIILLIICGIVFFKNYKTKNNFTNINNNKSNEELVIPINEDNINQIKKMYIEINGTKLSATLEDNNSSEEFIEKLKQSSITIDMHDYANMEKVGDLGFSIKKSDNQISVSSGDIILYQGNKITIYYGNNNWNFTRLGHIDNISSKDLKSLLGEGNIFVKFSVE